MMGGGMMGGGMDMGPLRLNRYVDVTAQVRRLPVAMVVTVDQAHIQDFLTAFANSRLRIQTTQVHWQHSYEPIKPGSYEFGTEGGAMMAGPGGGGDADRPGGMVPGVGPAGMGGAGVRGPGAGMAGLGPGGMMPGGMMPGGMMPGGMRGGSMPSVGEGSAMGGRMGGAGRMMAGGAYRGMNLGMMPGDTDFAGMPGYGMMGGMGYPQEGELETFNLVELTVYGIASLYERYPPKPPEPEQPAEPDPAAATK
jgi:hypothetical protein